jgi:hypothetical protein
MAKRTLRQWVGEYIVILEARKNSDLKAVLEENDELTATGLTWRYAALSRVVDDLTALLEAEERERGQRGR